MTASDISSVLIFKDGYYYLSVNIGKIRSESPPTEYDVYAVAPTEVAEYNGFEFPGDAYSYLSKLKIEKKVG